MEDAIFVRVDTEAKQNLHVAVKYTKLFRCKIIESTCNYLGLV